MKTTVLNIIGTNRFMPHSSEPVFLLRGQDELAAATVLYWAANAESRCLDPAMVKSAREQAARMVKWPVKKMPDMRPAAEEGMNFVFRGLTPEFEPFTKQGCIVSVDDENDTVLLAFNDSEKQQTLTIQAWEELIERGQLVVTSDPELSGSESAPEPSDDQTRGQ